MKTVNVNVNVLDILKAAQQAATIINPQQKQMDILQYLLLEVAADGVGVMSATNLDTTVSSHRFVADIYGNIPDNGFAVVVRADALIDFLEKHKPTKSKASVHPLACFEFTYDDENAFAHCNVSCGAGTLTVLPCEHFYRFPVLPLVGCKQQGA